MILRAAGTHSCRPSAQPVACVRAHASCCRQVAFQHRSVSSLDHQPPLRKVTCGSYYTGYTSYDSDDSDDDEQGLDEENEDGDAPFEIHHVHTRLPLRCVSLGDNYTHVISYEDGDLAWSEGLSDGLYAELNNAKRRSKSIASVSLGRNQGSDSYRAAADPGEVYFMRRDTGTTYMGGSCSKELRQLWWDSKGDDRVENVAFAPSCGWCIRTEGGGGQWHNLPDSLADTLHEHWWPEGGLKHLSVGHNGEWFVLFESGAFWWQGLHPTLVRLLESGKVGGRTCRVEWVELGPDDTFVALFDNHTVWYGSQVLTEHLLSCM